MFPFRLLHQVYNLILFIECDQARCKVELDPTLDEVKKLCNTCRRYAKSERVLFHYNGHGVPKPTANGEIWLFNKVFFCLTVMKQFLLLLVCTICQIVSLLSLIISCAELYTVYSLAYQ